MATKRKTAAKRAAAKPAAQKKKATKPKAPAATAKPQRAAKAARPAAAAVRRRRATAARRPAARRTGVRTAAPLPPVSIPQWEWAPPSLRNETVAAPKKAVTRRRPAVKTAPVGKRVRRVRRSSGPAVIVPDLEPRIVRRPVKRSSAARVAAIRRLAAGVVRRRTAKRAAESAVARAATRRRATGVARPAVKPAKAAPCPVRRAAAPRPAAKPVVRPAARPVAAKPYIDYGPRLPEQYRDDTMFAMVRDPEWVFVYWELTGQVLARLRRRFGAIRRAAWRLVGVAADGRVRFSAQPPANVLGTWYCKVGPQAELYFALRARLADGREVELLRSNLVRTPRLQPSAQTDVAWYVSEPDFVARFLAAYEPPYTSGQKRSFRGFGKLPLNLPTSGSVPR